MVPGDRLLCAFVERRAVGDRFVDWPLHITIVPWFRVEVPTDQLTSLLASTLSSVHSFTVVLDGQANFGSSGQKAVQLVAAPSPLWQIERAARALLHRHHARLVDETTNHHYAYRPHVTNQPQVRAQPGDTFPCRKLYVIEQRGDHKIVTGTVELAP